MTETPAALMLVTMNCDLAHEEEFNRWYWQEHIPERMAVPGFRSARRFMAIDGEPKYLALYDVDSLDVLSDGPYRTIYENPSEWTLKMRQHYKANRTLWVEILPPKAPK